MAKMFCQLRQIHPVLEGAARYKTEFRLPVFHPGTVSLGSDELLVQTCRRQLSVLRIRQLMFLMDMLLEVPNVFAI